MLSAAIPQEEWEAAVAELPLLARRGDLIGEDLATRLAAQPVNLVRVVSRRAGAEVRGVAPDTIRNPMSLPVRIFQPTTSAALGAPGMVLTEEIVERIHELQMQGLTVAEYPGELPERLGFELADAIPALAADVDVGRVALRAEMSIQAVTPVVTRITAWLEANEEEDAIIAQANAKLNADG